MKTIPEQQEKQYARVARVFPKTIFSTTYARIRVMDANKCQK